jgi:hypothetical protein
MEHISRALYMNDLGFSSTIFESNLKNKEVKYLNKYIDKINNIDAMSNMSSQVHEDNLKREKIIFYGNDKIKFYTEKVVPAFQSDKKKIMLLFSNPHPKSVIKGMFHSNQSAQSVNFWKYLAEADIFSFSNATIDSSTADIFINGDYKSAFQLFFQCYFTFPTRKSPEELQTLFSEEYYRDLVEKGKNDLLDTINKFSIDGIICFNQDIFNIVRNSFDLGNTKRLDEGKLVKDCTRNSNKTPIYFVYPTSWYDPQDQRHADIRKNAVTALRNIKRDIQKTERVDINGDLEKKLNVRTEACLWHIFHSPKIQHYRTDLIVFSGAKEIKEGDFIIYEIMPNKLAGLFKVSKILKDLDADYDRRLASKDVMGFPFYYQYKIEPIIEYFKRPLDKRSKPELMNMLDEYRNNYAVKIDKHHLQTVNDIFLKHMTS